jgi:hypothetical protein
MMNERPVGLSGGAQHNNYEKMEGLSTFVDTL